ncbi:alkaline phosphatase family protein [Aestuariibacter halophilus]|uniref:Alkaline phosphatase family protein n=1 Tax=Fluctibacter halophilus TaxID=226011 RepID=A0ABS8GBS9_9ALTE|nr:alkaline phosphatase family protein [Aestuariibacter halophilus]MCC2617869.1 alkaline phosphatase family protein [Aestuariibacter halophilus]
MTSDVSLRDVPVPALLSGPILRHVSHNILTVWIATREPMDWHLTVTADDQSTVVDGQLGDDCVNALQIGQRAWVYLLQPRDLSLPSDQELHYRLRYRPTETTTWHSIEGISYAEDDTARFRVPTTLNNVLHGSCRKPHHDSDDGLLQVDRRLQQAHNQQVAFPDLLMMSGDQVYADDVAGPMLWAIQQTIDMLGLFEEQFEGAIVSDSQALRQHPHSFYQRHLMLPKTAAMKHVYRTFFAAKRKPVFTSVNANNHLVSFSEMMALYLLSWSPNVWQCLPDSNPDIGPAFQAQYDKEAKLINGFRQGLAEVRRALANIPCYMIFDDHDVTDDWNLTRGWEEAVYQQPFARRIVGNALAAYWVCQGWGNPGGNTDALKNSARQALSAPLGSEQDAWIDTLLDWDEWDYHLDTTPKMIVLDTRTQRWRSESSLTKPSGLMDWEKLCDLQQQLIGQPSVILVSAAPIFGVKLIETIQRIFTFFGKALTVDAENWMAHKGTASVMLNIFRHQKTPPHFIILSGDVHYSFVYDISLRFRRNSPRITQITSSGIKNTFPHGLLRWLDRLNRVLYHRRSPLNWFTQRRRMVVRHRHPDDHPTRTLLNRSGIGLLSLSEKNNKVGAESLTSSGTVRFK